MTNTEENIKKVKEIVLENRHTNLKELASEHNVVCGMVQHIVVVFLVMRYIEARLIQEDLTFFQKHHYKTVAEDLVSQVKNDLTFIKKIITGSETWVCKYNVKTSHQSSECHLENKLEQQQQNKITPKSL